jgi:hypothetical protein
VTSRDVSRRQLMGKTEIGVKQELAGIYKDNIGYREMAG